MDSDITVADAPTAELDRAILAFARFVQSCANQAIELTGIVATFDKVALSTGLGQPQHDGPTDIAAAKLVSAVAGLKYAGVQLVEAFVTREREISPMPVGPDWN